MPSAGLLCLLTISIGFSLVEARHFLVETEDKPQGKTGLKEGDFLRAMLFEPRNW